MMRARGPSAGLRAALLLTIITGLLPGCAGRGLSTPEGRGDATLVVLLPDPGTDTVGRASVSNRRGAVELDEAREFTLIGLKRQPTRVRVASEAAVERLFAEALEALPPAPAHFTLFFKFESDELTDRGRALLPAVLQAMKDRPVPEVSVVGHTDTTGTSASNFELGMKRATMVRGLLLEAGLDPSALEIASHGEAVLLVPTADETYEPRNRRVEITIR